ncbi:MAG: glycosyltransferase, partial [Candidatus Dadabacteria bacterium]|nr:glycosyltransferase [Candidatus Dadabacteria bacterium]
ASALIYPSLYEGFGLPPLEALACGCPVVISDENEATKEILGKFAYCFKSDNKKSLESIINEAVVCPEKKIIAGKLYSSTFTWSNTVNKLDEYIKDIICE